MHAFKIDEKRFYVPGVEAACPKCGEITKNDYLSTPTANTPIAVLFWCGPCGHEWKQRITLTVYVEVHQLEDFTTAKVRL